MTRKLFRIAAFALALTFAASQAFGQVTFRGYVPHADESLIPEKESEPGNSFDTEYDEPRLLTLELSPENDEIFLPQSRLIVPGSGTIPNSAFLSETLGRLGFETPTAPYILLDSLTHKQVELYSFDDLIGFMKTQPNGSVFIVGIDFHAGFIRIEDGAVSFLGAENGTSSAVPLEDAPALKNSKIFVIGDLSEHSRILVGVDTI